MIAVHQPNTEPLPGYRLLEPLGKGGFGEVWKCEAPGGLIKAIKFVAGQSQNLGDDNNGAAQELRALQHIKTIRHPFLLSMDRVEIVKGDLLIVMELADRTLQDLLEEYRSKGQPGIPRDELLAYLQEAAEVLDLMNQEHHLQHLDIKPRNLFLVGRHVKVADFGLVNTVANCNGDKPSSLHLGAITPTYAAPESFAGKISSSSDQYSLAVTYHELLTGSVPFDGKSFRQLAMQHMQAVPNLCALPESDRPAVARALAKDPQERFPTCGAFVQALLAGSSGSGQTGVPAQTFVVEDSSKRQSDGTNSTNELPTETRPVAPSQTSSPLEFAGLHLKECLSRQCGGELWRAVTKDGRKRLVRFLIAPAAGGDGDPMARLAQLKHSCLAKMEVVRDGPNRVGLVIEAGDDNLGTRLKECIQAGKPGIPRGELLDRLAEVAAALDDLYEEHQVPHLTISPRTVALVGGKARLLDFGMATLFWLPAGEQAGALNPRYAAPELFGETIAPQSDQFSLAMLFAEMLTGVHPYRSVSVRQMINPFQRGAPDVTKLSSTDRALVLRALHPKIVRRFANCSEFIEALSDMPQAPQAPSVKSPVHVPVVDKTTKTVTPLGITPVAIPGTPAVNELVAFATKGHEVRDKGDIRYLLKPGISIRHQCCARLVPGMVRLKLYPFRDQWRATLTERKAEERFMFQVPLPVSIWQRVTGRLPCLAVEVRCTLPPNENVALADIDVEICPEACGEAQAIDILEKVGPRLLDSLWVCLNATPDRRGNLRLPFEYPVQLAPVGDGELGPAIAARTRDVSTLGMSVLMPCRPPWTQVSVLVSLPSRPEPASLKAHVVRVSECKTGGFEVGLAFV